MSEAAFPVWADFGRLLWDGATAYGVAGMSGLRELSLQLCQMKGSCVADPVRGKSREHGKAHGSRMKLRWSPTERRR